MQNIKREIEEEEEEKLIMNYYERQNLDDLN